MGLPEYLKCVLTLAACMASTETTPLTGGSVNQAAFLVSVPPSCPCSTPGVEAAPAAGVVEAVLSAVPGRGTAPRFHQVFKIWLITIL